MVCCLLQSMIMNHRLRDILDEIFQREDAFYGHIAWQKRYATSNDAKGFSAMFDHVLVYRKSETFSRNLTARTVENDSNYRHEDEKGVFRSDNYTCNKTAEERPNLYYGYKHLLRGGGGTVPSTWWPHDFAGHTDEAKKRAPRNHA